VLVQGVPRRTIWADDDTRSVRALDQTRLPHALEIVELRTLDDVARAIETMTVRGAPLIGAAGAYGLALALRVDASDTALDVAGRTLLATRPTAVNLRWALDRVAADVGQRPVDERADAAWALAATICDEDVATCRAIAGHGADLLRRLRERADSAGRPVNVLTHCNAGWLATVDWGTALAPVYLVHDEGLDVHVWVDETRPRQQGAGLTAWELGEHGVPYTVIVDNAGGHLMRDGLVDCCLTGSDRTTARGDVCNKIGTYLKALAARDNDVPFYVALPGSTIDWTIEDGQAGIEIEQRPDDEVRRVTGRLPDGTIAEVEVTAPGAPVCNPAFDVTPARLVTALVTERGVTEASAEGLARLYPEHATAAGGVP
jgi:methylthioribose-1-phosphate isomerase